jgi:hypothetical protein
LFVSGGQNALESNAVMLCMQRNALLEMKRCISIPSFAAWACQFLSYQCTKPPYPPKIKSSTLNRYCSWPEPQIQNGPCGYFVTAAHACTLVHHDMMNTPTGEDFQSAEISLNNNHPSKKTFHYQL